MVKTRTPGIYKRGGRFVVVYYVNGKQRKESARSYADAKRLKAARLADVARGEFHDATRLTFRDYFLEWVERYQGRGRQGFRESTRREYRRLGIQYALVHFGERKRLTEITPRAIANFIHWLCDEEQQGKRLADTTVRNALNPVRACLGTAKREGLIRTNPADGAALPHRPASPTEEPQRRVLSREELGAFLRIVPARHRLFFRLLATTGLRISEALGLTWWDLRLDGSRPHVAVRRAWVGRKLVPPKTRNGAPTVPLHEALVLDLHAHRSKSDWSGDDAFVFPSKSGEPMDADNLRTRVLRPTAEEAGVPWATFHSFRHTCASLLFARGANAVQVQRWLGHHSAAFTLERYVSLLPDELGDPLNLSDELRAGSNGSGPDGLSLPHSLPPVAISRANQVSESLETP